MPKPSLLKTDKNVTKQFSHGFFTIMIFIKAYCQLGFLDILFPSHYPSLEQMNVVFSGRPAQYNSAVSTEVYIYIYIYIYKYRFKEKTKDRLF